MLKHRLQREREGHTGKGRKFFPCLKMEELESDAKIQRMVGNPQDGTHGVGYGARRTFIGDTNRERRRQLVLF